jgi:hypothetical protein
MAMTETQMQHALACAVVQQKWAKEAALDIAAHPFTNPHFNGDLAALNAGRLQRAAKAMNQSRYHRRCAHNLRVAIAAHRGRHPGGVGRVAGIQVWNQRRRQQKRRLLAAVKELGTAV